VPVSIIVQVLNRYVYHKDDLESGNCLSASHSLAKLCAFWKVLIDDDSDNPSYVGGWRLGGRGERERRPLFSHNISWRLLVYEKREFVFF